MAFSKKSLLAAAIAGIAAVSLVTPASLADDYSYVNAEHLNVRSLGSVRGYIVATVDKGYRMTVLETVDRGWKRVLLENGQEGFVNGKYLSEEVPAYEKVASTRYSVKVAHAFVRSDGLLKKIAVVDAGDQLEAVSDRVFFGKWIRVRVASSANPGYVGRVGYINQKLVEAVDGYQFAEEAVETSDMDASMEEAQDSSDEAMATEETSEEIPEELNSAPEETGSSEESSDDDLAKLLEGL
ncbi:MAG: peptidoglycan DL-endopeptidase LytF [Patescibacteria group bacterium]|nr:peptidoglycan DL-endopeptidase LytF [Patescibacteria group bacterium]